MPNRHFCDIVIFIIMSLKLLQIIQIITAIVLSGLILVQSRGTALSGIFGGTSNVYRTKRGVERTLFILTIITAVIFFLISFVGIMVHRG